MLFMAAVGAWGLFAYLRGQAVSATTPAPWRSVRRWSSPRSRRSNYARGGRAAPERHALPLRNHRSVRAAIRMVISSSPKPAPSTTDLQSHRAVHLRTGRTRNRDRSLVRAPAASASRTAPNGRPLNRDHCHPGITGQIPNLPVGCLAVTGTKLTKTYPPTYDPPVPVSPERTVPC